MNKHHHRFLVPHLIPIKLGEIDGETQSATQSSLQASKPSERNILGNDRDLIWVESEMKACRRRETEY